MKKEDEYQMVEERKHEKDAEDISRKEEEKEYEEFYSEISRPRNRKIGDDKQDMEEYWFWGYEE